jgi:hypothetical protein
MFLYFTRTHADVYMFTYIYMQCVTYYICLVLFKYDVIVILQGKVRMLYDFYEVNFTFITNM